MSEIKRVTDIDLSRVNSDQALVLIGQHDDGRKINLAIHVFRTSNYVYGKLLATEQPINSPERIALTELNSYTARLPRNGMLTIGSFAIEISQLSRPPYPEESLEAENWMELPVTCTELELVTIQ